jgi:anti-sigma regulatory factor (Ser/Thr protein kinase)
MSTLICQVQSRWPVAVVSVYGTLDTNSAARLMVALRDTLAEAPSALLLDVAHLEVSVDSALVPLVWLADEAQRWPAITIGLCAATPATAAAVERVGADSGAMTGLKMYDDTAAASEVARQLPVPPRRSLTLSPTPGAPAEAREFTHEICVEWGIGRVANLAELVASELVTNAVMHARTQIAVTLRLSGDTLSVAVRDGDPRPMFRPAPGSGAPSDEHGRGLLLLDAMADAWGSTPTADGKVVWANINVRRPSRATD